MQRSKGKDMGDLKFQLPINTRDDLKKLLTDFSSMLAGDSTKDIVLVSNRNAEMISQLSELDRFEEENEESRRKRLKLTDDPSAHPSASQSIQYVLELSYEQRKKITDILEANEELAIGSPDLQWAEIKKNMIEENRQLIEQVNALKRRIAENYDMSSSSDEDDDGEDQETAESVYVVPQRVPKNQPVLNGDETTEIDKSIARELDKRVLLMNNLLREQWEQRLNEELDRRMKEIKEEMEKLKKETNQKIREIDIYRKKKTFDYRLKNVTAFFHESNKRFSEFFYCFSFKWSILVAYKKSSSEHSDGFKYLQLYLLREEPLDQDEHEATPIDWECEVKFDFTILSQSPESVPNKVEKFDKFVFTCPSKFASYGEDKVISYKALKQGFITSDDCIDIQLNMKVTSFRRY